jgi:hypothetical protein
MVAAFLCGYAREEDEKGSSGQTALCAHNEACFPYIQTESVERRIYEGWGYVFSSAHDETMGTARGVQ